MPRRRYGAKFQPTLPARGATASPLSSSILRMISTHAPRTGSDWWADSYIICTINFNPRSPHGERHHGNHPVLRWNVFQPTLPARGATRPTMTAARSRRISTHAPRTGSDSPGSCGPPPLSGDFNPRSPHGERHDQHEILHRLRLISTHAPRTGSDAFPCPASRAYSNFNPRSPHGERPADAGFPPCAVPISTHAPRTGSDKQLKAVNNRNGYFNPRSPHGERRQDDSGIIRIDAFQPTLPARGATLRQYRAENRQRISTHAPRTGSDHNWEE